MGIGEVTNATLKRVTEEMNTELTKVYTRDKVTKALQQLHPTKALGPDDMSAIFIINTGTLWGQISQTWC